MTDLQQTRELGPRRRRSGSRHACASKASSAFPRFCCCRLVLTCMQKSSRWNNV